MNRTLDVSEKMTGRPEMIEVHDAKLLKETDNAYYIMWDCDELRTWFPKYTKQGVTLSEYDKSEQVLHVAKWLYDKKVDEVLHG